MTTPKSLPEQTIHSNNGNAAVSTETSTTEQKRSARPDPQTENRDRILPDWSLPMDFRKATIREVLEYFLRTGDEAAWAEFWRRVRPTIRGRCASMLDGCFDELLDDLEQNAFLKLWPNDQKVLRRFTWPDDNSIFRYMRVVAASVVIDYCRKNNREIFLDPEDLALIMDKTFAGHRPSDLEIMRGEIDKYLRTFASERDRQIFWFFYRWGLTAKQIANLPGINLPVRKVENILQGLVRRLGDKLRKHGKGASPD